MHHAELKTVAILVMAVQAAEMPALEMFLQVVLKLKQQLQRMCEPVVLVVVVLVVVVQAAGTIAVPKQLPQVVVRLAKRLQYISLVVVAMVVVPNGGFDGCPRTSGLW